MSNSGMGFGGFLLGVGGGWILFRTIDVTFDLFSYILILAGAGIIINTLLSSRRRRSPIHGLFGGIIGGLILTAFITNGVSIFSNITDDVTNFDSSTYRATETQALQGDIDLEALSLEVNNFNGGITASSWSQDKYEIILTIKAKGNTNTKAENRINDLEVLFSDVAVSGTQLLTLTFRNPDNNWSNYAILIEIKIPKYKELNLSLKTSNGAIELSEIIAENVNLETSNGNLVLNEVYSSMLNGETSNGGIEGTIEGKNVELQTSNGIIDLNLESTHSGDYAFKTTNGDIELKTSTRDTIGYYVDLDTTIGNVDINLPDMTFSLNQDKHKIGQTNRYNEKDLQVNIIAETTIGRINLN